MAFKMKGFPFAGKSPMYQKEEEKGEKTKGVTKHPLYDKLPAWAKEAYNKLDEAGKRAALKNKSEEQLLNYLGDYTPEFEGGD